MEFVEEYFDAVLVTTGPLIMFVYHLFLLYQYIHYPLRTSIGYENKDKETWIQKIMQGSGDDDKVRNNVSTGLGVISLNTNVTIYDPRINLFNSLRCHRRLDFKFDQEYFPLGMIYGNKSQSIICVKYLCLLTCFLLAFSFFVQSARHFVHSNYLLNTPGATADEDVEKVEQAVKTGSIFWSLGLRALYLLLISCYGFLGL